MSTELFADKPLILLGAGGHAKVLLSLVKSLGMTVQAVCDPVLAGQGIMEWRGIPVLGGDEALDAVSPDAVGLINGVGQLVGGDGRRKLFDVLKRKGFYFPPLVHSSAWVDPSVMLSEGVQVMAGVVIQADASIGENCIINTRVSVDHDCVIGPHVHIAPGAVLCGNVRAAAHAYIGCGANVIQDITIGERAVVGAGTTVVRSLSSDEVILGAPVRKQPIAAGKQEIK